MNTTGAHSLVQRAIGAALLRTEIYEEVEADRSATGQAAIVVGIVAVASAIAASSEGTASVLGGIVSAFLGWLIWAAVTNLVGTRLFGGTADWGELLRTLGFAQAPGVFMVVAAVPALRSLVELILLVWLLVAGIIAIRQALDFTTGKAVLTALIAMAFVIVAMIALGVLTGATVGVAAMLTGRA